LQVALDHRQQVVEVVRDAAGKLAYRLHLLHLLKLLADLVVLADVAKPLDGVAQHPRQHGAIDDVLHQVVLGTLGDRFERRLLVVVVREHDHRQLRVRLQERLQGIDALAVGQEQVHQHDVDVVCPREGNAFGKAGGATDLERIAIVPFQRARNQTRVVGIVLDQQDGDRRRTVSPVPRRHLHTPGDGIVHGAYGRRRGDGLVRPDCTVGFSFALSSYWCGNQSGRQHPACNTRPRGLPATTGNQSSRGPGAVSWRPLPRLPDPPPMAVCAPTRTRAATGLFNTRDVGTPVGARRSAAPRSAADSPSRGAGFDYNQGKPPCMSTRVSARGQTGGAHRSHGLIKDRRGACSRGALPMAQHRSRSCSMSIGEPASRARPGTDAGPAPRRAALRFAAIYTLVGAAWIVVSDLAFDWATDAPTRMTAVQIAKGIFYVLVTAVLVYALTLRALRRIRDEFEAVQLEKSRNMLEAVLGNLGDAVLVIDPASRSIISCNSAVQKVFGYEPQELIGRGSEILHVDRQAWQEFGRIGEGALDARGVFRCQYRMRRKDGTIIDAENTVATVDRAAGW